MGVKKFRKIEEENMAKSFEIANKKKVTSFLIEQRADSGVQKIAKKVAKDIELVTCQLPTIYQKIEEVDREVIFVATVGKSDLLEELEKKGLLDLSRLKGKREVYQISILEHPFEKIDKALVICGSDKRGTIYGLFQLSEWLGVSTWIYWADVVPKHKECAVIELEKAYTSKEPSVKYRGFFINDEWPAFGNWTFEHFGGFTAEMYDKVFELLLRLKGNYLWPAMWSSSFSLDGPGLASAELANEYGVVMGQSHHEPCLRASEEWDIYKGKDTPYGTEWNYYTNKEGLLNYWKEGLKRSGQYETVITIGMRGERDSSMLGEDSTLGENIDLLKDIIKQQRKLIQEHVNENLEEVPQMLALYKEVEAYFYGDEKTPGLNEWEELEGVTLMLCEDNFGNMRTLPTAAKKERKGGWGMYYHFDYHGAPISYEWVNSTPLSKVWEQMSMAYDYGIKDIWIVNVGDLKPQEFPLSYFMALAYDFEKWGTKGINETQTFTKEWVETQFRAAFSKTQQEKVVALLEGYTRLNGRCRPEVVSSKTYHPVLFNEAHRMLEEIDSLSYEAKVLLEEVPNIYKPAFVELVYFPAMASFNLNRMQIMAGLNHHAALSGKVIANVYAEEVKKCIQRDEALRNQYHELLEGKWNGMALSAHIGFTHWNDEDWRYPICHMVQPVNGSRLIVSAEGMERSTTGGVYPITRVISNKATEVKVILDNGGNSGYDFEVITDQSWMKVSTLKGHVETQEILTFTFDLTTPKGEATALIKGAESTVKVVFHLETLVLPKEPMTFVRYNAPITIEAEHFAKVKNTEKAKWQVIENYGRTLSGVKVFPTTVSFEIEEEAPTLTYQIEVKESGIYQIEVQCAPANPLSPNGKLRYGLKVNEENWQVINRVAENYRGGNWNDRAWCKQVLENINRSGAAIFLQQGKNTIDIKAMDAGMVMERLVIYKEKEQSFDSYLGPEESPYKA